MNTTMTTALTCASCHDTHGGRVEGDDLGDLLLVEGETEGNPVCYGCHGVESTLEGGDLSVFEGSGHNAQLEELGDTAGITCLVCHETHGSTADYLLRYDTYNGCFRCHSAESPSPGATDILSRFNLSGDSMAHHDIFKEDQEANGTRLSCANCHNTHSTTEEYPLVDPNNPSPDGEWTGGTDSIAAFCFRCHDGDLPTAAQTGSWVAPPLSYDGTSTTADIETAWQSDFHGFGTGTDADLRPDMGWLDGAVVSCDACHARHGGVNSHNLRGEVLSSDGLRVVSGAMVYDIPEALGGGHDMRFFCVTCHDLTGDFCEKHTANFPTDCTQCHTHIGGGL
jgi:predicted CXXCH cytochrome family protein